jgi:hypothetical protein
MKNIAFTFLLVTLVFSTTTLRAAEVSGDALKYQQNTGLAGDPANVPPSETRDLAASAATCPKGDCPPPKGLQDVGTHGARPAQDQLITPAGAAPASNRDQSAPLGQ